MVLISLIVKQLCVVSHRALCWAHFLVCLLYVNDIANSSKHFSFYLFADDTHIIYANKNLHNLETDS